MDRNRIFEQKSVVPGSDENYNWDQKWEKAIRAQIPQDKTMGGRKWTPGTMPKGGFQSIFDFSKEGHTSTKISGTERGIGKKVY